MTRTYILRASVAAALAISGGAYAAELTMFSGPDFRGSDMTIHGGVPNLDRTGFNDRAESIIVRSGRWEVCSDANFSGYCAMFGPGDYRILEGPLYRRISSAREREVAPLAYDERRYYRYGTNGDYIPDDRGRDSAAAR
jgi:hypothetical protein